MKKILTIGVVVILLVLIFVYSQETKKKVGSIKVGVPIILSGDFAVVGERAKKSMQMAVEDFKVAHPETTVEVIYEDTEAKPSKALLAYEKLTKVDKTDLIVGILLQTEQQALFPKIVADNQPTFSMSPLPIEMRGKSNNPLTLWPDPSLEAEQLAEYVYKSGALTASILGTKDSWEYEVSNAFAKRFEELGGKVLNKEITLPLGNDVRDPVTKVVNNKPDAIFLGTYYKFTPFLKTINALGYKGKIYSIELDSGIVGDNKGISDGLQFISPDYYTNDFVKKFEQKYNEKPSLPAGQAYDVMMLALTTYYKNQSAGEVLNAMSKINEYKGVSGLMHFSPDRRAVFPLSIFEIQNGEIKRKDVK